MILRIFPIVSVLVPALGAAATAMAQPAAYAFGEFDQAGIIYQNTPLWPYDQPSAIAANAAYVGAGSDPSYGRDQPNVLHEPVYDFYGG